ncbi:MAG: hypothetical protein KC457_35750, partial [Myxococcales bacterium]|nr:hypothetical protein [Myxococcales bacterium]
MASPTKAMATDPDLRPIGRRRFEIVEDGIRRFWEIEARGDPYATWEGVVGAPATFRPPKIQ